MHVVSAQIVDDSSRQAGGYFFGCIPLFGDVRVVRAPDAQGGDRDVRDRRARRRRAGDVELLGRYTGCRVAVPIESCTPEKLVSDLVE